MKVLVCGGRNYNDYHRVWDELARIDLETPISCIVHGDATGADRHADNWAIARHIRRTPYRADWTIYGRSAGPIRNAQMLNDECPNLVLAFPGGVGTADMVRRAKANGFCVIEVTPAESRKEQ